MVFNVVFSNTFIGITFLFLLLTEPVSSDEGIGKSLIQGTSDEKIQAKSDLIETETIEVITVSEFEVDGDNLTHLGTELEDVLQPVPEDGPPERTPSLPNESGVLTYELNTVTNVIIDENGEPVNMEESIIPPEDLNSVVENNDSQISRLEGMDVILELEKIKTQLSQTQRALDAEKEKSQILEQTLNQVRVWNFTTLLNSLKIIVDNDSFVSAYRSVLSQINNDQMEMLVVSEIQQLNRKLRSLYMK